MKQETVARVLRDGNLLPRLTNQALHLERLQDADFCGSQEHKDLVLLGPDWRLGHENVRLFAREMIRQASVSKVPLYAAEIVHGSCDILHAQYQELLGEHDWRVLCHFGYQAAQRLELTVECKSPHRPQRWYVEVPEYVTPRMSDELKRQLLNESIDEVLNSNALPISYR